MKLLTFLASAAYLSAILAFPLSDKPGGVKRLTEGFTKRQNQQALSAVIASIDNVVMQFGGQDRGQFTQDVVQTLWNNNKNYNYVICHVNHNYVFQGSQGVDWDRHQITVAPGNSATSFSFDIIVGGAGTFFRYGDGGYINWSYIGNVASRTDLPPDEEILVFNAP